MFRHWTLSAFLAISTLAAGCAGSKDQVRSEPAATTTATAAPHVNGPRKRIAIVAFTNASNSTGWGSSRDALADSAADAATEALVKSGAFVVVEREQLQHVLAEQGLGQTGAITAQSAAQAGKLLGLQAIVTGKVTDFAEERKNGGFGGYYSSSTRIAKARVSLRVTDAQTGEVWVAESGEGAADEKSVNVMGGGGGGRDENLGKAALYSAVNQLVGKIVAKADLHPWQGAVAKENREGRVYITGGSESGLTVGSVLEVRRQGEAITDPGTGQVIGRESGKLVGILTVAEHLGEKLSACDAKEGRGFLAGDVVVVKALAH
jgi:curli biogenesis system outer membrane secretion channel CsgG